MAGTPRRLFDASAYPAIGLGRHFDVGPGDRFVMLKRVASPPPVVRILLHFHDEVATTPK